MSHYQPHQNHIEQLVKVADYLNERQEAILEDWHSAVERDEQLGCARGFSKAEFEGQIPELLQFLNAQIRKACELPEKQPDEGEDAAEPSLMKQDHVALQQFGFKRWQAGYEMRQILQEWAHLNLTLVRILNAYEAMALTENEQGASHQSTAKAIATARLLASQLCDAGYLQIISEYHLHHQAEVKEIVRGLSESLEQTVQWERARGQVLREAVHDVRGNLFAIQGAVSLLDTAPPEAHSSVSDLLRRSTETLFQMLSELLDLSRLEAGHEEFNLEKFDAAGLIKGLCEHTEPLAIGKGLTLTYVGPAALMAQSDMIKVRRIAQNLLLNALKYTFEGGVTVTCREVDEKQWRLSIADTGLGFTQSQQVAPDGRASRGEGVGLIIVKRLCVLLEAELKMDSVAGKGTTFHITWPRHYEVVNSDAAFSHLDIKYRSP